jgi:hypothetical protein
MKTLCIFLLAANSALALSWSNWHPQAWSAARLPTAETVSLYAVENVVPYTEWLPPFPSTNPVATNVTFLSDIVFDYPDAGPITNVWNLTALDSNGTAVAFAYTNVAAQVKTNLSLQAGGVRTLDLYRAIKERYLMANLGATNNVPKPRYYREEYSAAVYYKLVVESMLNTLRFASPWALSGGKYDAYYAASSNQATPSLTATPRTNGITYWQGGRDLYFAPAHLGLPSNYFALTFHRDLAGLAPAIPRVQSISYVTGTNTNTVVTTNAVIHAGHTSTDYSVQGLRRLLTNMSGITSGVDYFGDWIDSQHGDSDATGYSFLADYWSPTDWGGQRYYDYTPGLAEVLPYQSYWSYHYAIPPQQGSAVFPIKSGQSWIGTLQARLERDRGLASSAAAMPRYVGTQLPKQVNYYLRWQRPTSFGQWLNPGLTTSLYNHASSTVSSNSPLDQFSAESIGSLFFPAQQTVYEIDDVSVYGGHAIYGEAVVYPAFEYR